MTTRIDNLEIASAHLQKRADELARIIRHLRTNVEWAREYQNTDNVYTAGELDILQSRIRLVVAGIDKTIEQDIEYVGADK